MVGLRAGELQNLQITDIDSKRMLVIIRAAKGKKDRVSLLSTKALRCLRDYYKLHQPKKWLFEGAGGNQYSLSSLRSVLKINLKKAGILKHIRLHDLRHSFATHLLEGGTDLRYIQSILGHNSSKTTEIYTHINKKHIQLINNPLDS